MARSRNFATVPSFTTFFTFALRLSLRSRKFVRNRWPMWHQFHILRFLVHSRGWAQYLKALSSSMLQTCHIFSCRLCWRRTLQTALRLRGWLVEYTRSHLRWVRCNRTRFVDIYWPTLLLCLLLMLKANTFTSIQWLSLHDCIYSNTMMNNHGVMLSRCMNSAVLTQIHQLCRMVVMWQ